MTRDLTRLMLSLMGRGRSTAAALGPGDDRANIVGHTEEHAPVLWPERSPRSAAHVADFAASGTGKTVKVAKATLHEFLLPGNEGALFAIDPKGDLAHHFVTGLAAMAPNRLRDVVYLNPFAPGGFPFNLNHLAQGKVPNEIRALQLAELVSEVSTSVGGNHVSMGSRQVDVLQQVLLAALEVPDPRACALFALDALTAEHGLLQLAKLTRSARARAFLESTKRISEELRVSTCARLRMAFASTDALERLISADGCVQFKNLLAPGKLTILDIGEPIGGLAVLQSIFANLLARLAIEYLMERPSPWKGHHVRIVIDEAQVVAPVLKDVAERVLTTGRSRGISLVIMTQGTTLLPESLLRVILANTPTTFVGRLAASDAELFSRTQSPAFGVDESVSAVRSRFAASVTNLRDRAFFHLAPGTRERFTTAPVDLRGWEHAAREHASEIEAMERRLALPETSAPRTRLGDLFGAGDTDRASSADRPSRTRARRPAGPVTEAEPTPDPNLPKKPRSPWG